MKTYKRPLIDILNIENDKNILMCSGDITVTVPDVESGQPCGCNCPCDELPPGSCHCTGCSPNDPCLFFDGECMN